MSIANIDSGERRLDVLELLDLPILALLVISPHLLIGPTAVPAY